MKNLIFIPFAFDQSKQTGLNVNKKKALEIYLKNLFKHINPFGGVFQIKYYHENMGIF